MRRAACPSTNETTANEGAANTALEQGFGADVAQDVAEDVSGAEDDGSVKVLISPIVIFQRRNPRPTHACRPPRLPLGDMRRTGT